MLTAFYIAVTLATQGSYQRLRMSRVARARCLDRLGSRGCCGVLASVGASNAVGSPDVSSNRSAELAVLTREADTLAAEGRDSTSDLRTNSVSGWFGRSSGRAHVRELRPGREVLVPVGGGRGEPLREA